MEFKDYNKYFKKYGITLRINSAEPCHHIPHFHIMKGKYIASVSLNNFEVLAGEIPVKDLRSVKKVFNETPGLKDYLITLYKQKNPCND